MGGYRPNTMHFISAHCHAETSTADEQGSISLAICDNLGSMNSHVRVALVICHSDIDHLLDSLVFSQVICQYCSILSTSII